jgi:hypothetical protein
MTPQRTTDREKGRTYCHYVSQAILQHRKGHAGSVARLSAPPAEGFVSQTLETISQLSGNKSRWDEASDYPKRRALVLRWLKRFEPRQHTATFTLDAAAITEDGKITEEVMLDRLRASFGYGVESTDGLIKLTLPARLKISSGAYRRELWDKGGWRSAKSQVDRSLIAALARAHRWRRLLEAGEITAVDDLARRDGIERRHAQRILRLAFLAPDLQQMIIAGRQPPTLQLSSLLDTDLPLLWADQRSAVGI